MAAIIEPGSIAMGLLSESRLSSMCKSGALSSGFAKILNAPEKMKKAALDAKIASHNGIAGSEADKAVDGFVSDVSAALSEGDKIIIAADRTAVFRLAADTVFPPFGKSRTPLG